MFKVGDRVRAIVVIPNRLSGSSLNPDEAYCIEAIHLKAGSNGLAELVGQRGFWDTSRFVLADEPKPIMVPVDPSCVPEGYEAVSVGKLIQQNEAFVICDEAVTYPALVASPSLIVRPIWKPSVSIKPGMWVYQKNGNWFICDSKPEFNGEWIGGGHICMFPPHIDFVPPPDGQPRQIK